jgi:serine/threonine protein kinase
MDDGPGVAAPHAFRAMTQPVPQPSADPYWSRVRDLFHEAIDADPAARAQLLAACDDASIRAEVQSLLGSHEQSDSFLDRSLWELAGDTRPKLEGTLVGAYRLVRSLGEGGMGSVFLATRDDGQFDQHVAVKLIRVGAAGNSLVQRFRQERQILAGFEHANIARLLDGGTTADGSPYLVMEYVDGIPIDRYCVERNLSTRERLRLFLQLCDAVQYAHRNLVIHRDIKPANILITADGTPKLLDFGIAKLMSHAVADATVTRMMTPDYASPEQLRGENVTTATDVYSLGLVLYELLTGAKPFDSKTRRPDSEPARPSTHARCAAISTTS